MKKLTTFLMVCLATTLASCGAKPDEPTHTHAAASAQFTWASDFKAASAKILCSCQTVLAEKVDAEVTSEITKNPDCFHEGEKTWTAAVAYSGKAFNDTKKESIKRTEHEHEYVAQVDATCDKDGVKEHYECSLCESLFIKEGDEYQIVQASDLVIEKGHLYGQLVPKQDAKCGVDGMQAHYQCSRCKAYFDASKNPTTKEALTIKAEEHSWSAWTSVDAENHSRKCSKCQETETKPHSLGYTQSATEEKHDVACTDCGYSQTGIACTYAWIEGDYKCACGRQPTVTIPEKVNLDFVVTDGNLTNGASATEFTVSGIGSNEVKDVKIGETSIWDAENKKLNNTAVAKLYGEQTLSVTIGQGENSKVVEGLTTKFVSKIIKTSAELQSMATIANKIANTVAVAEGEEGKVYDGYFELGGHINMNGVTWNQSNNMDIGGATYLRTDRGFFGVFDGCGYEISRLSTGDDRCGFIYSLQGTLKNTSFYIVKQVAGYKHSGIIPSGVGTVENVYIRQSAATGTYSAMLFGSNVDQWPRDNGEQNPSAVPTIKNVVYSATDTLANTTKGNTCAAVVGSTAKGTWPVISDLAVVCNAPYILNQFASRYSKDNKATELVTSAAFCAEFGDDATKVAVGKDQATVKTAKGEAWATAWNALWKTGGNALVF